MTRGKVHRAASEQPGSTRLHSLETARYKIQNIGHQAGRRIVSHDVAVVVPVLVARRWRGTASPIGLGYGTYRVVPWNGVARVKAWAIVAVTPAHRVGAVAWCEAIPIVIAEVISARPSATRPPRTTGITVDLLPTTAILVVLLSTPAIALLPTAGIARLPNTRIALLPSTGVAVVLLPAVIRSALVATMVVAITTALVVLWRPLCSYIASTCQQDASKRQAYDRRK